MRCTLVVAVFAAALVCAASTNEGRFSGIAEVFNTWDASKGPEYVDSFDHFALKVAGKDVHEEEHTRKKRNAREQQHFAALPITKACERPGYTGQYCEFPICREENPYINPDQYETDTGFYFDISVLANCTRVHYLIIDDTMTDIRIDLQSTDNVGPVFTLHNSSGDFQQWESYKIHPNSYEAIYKNLPPGMYELVPVPNPGMEKSHCVVYATARTHLTFSGGFSLDERERNDYYNEYAAAHQFNSIILHANNLRSPGELKTVQVIGPKNYIFRPRILDKRFGCTYEYYFDSFFCYESGSYAMIVEGIDFRGNIFRRASSFQCTAQVGPTDGPITTTRGPSPTRCGHGGILMSRPDNSTYCICQDHWTGYDCRVPMCVNGGSPEHDDDDGSNTCLCRPGFYGLHCEQVSCTEESGHGFGVDMPTLLFVVRVRKQMNDVVSQVTDAISQIVTNTQFDPSYFRRYHLVLFNNDTIVFNSHISTSDELIYQLNAKGQTNDTSGSCGDTVFGSIATSLTDIAITTKSVIYVITDALSDDYDDYGKTIFQWNSYWKATINFFFIEPAKGTGCETDISSPGFRSYSELANRFNGLAWHINNRSKVYDTMFTHMDNLLYRTQLMLSVDRRQCSKGLYKTIQIEKNNEQLIIVASGPDFYPFLTNPSGQQVTTELEELISHIGSYGMWRLKSPLIGQYIIKPATNPSTGGCSFRVYQGAYKSSNSIPQPELFWGIAADIDQDGGYLMQPVFGMDSHPVFHLTEFHNVEPDRVFSALTMYAERGDTEIEVYASNGIYREGCDYRFYFPAINCRNPGELIHFEFFVRDDVGYYIQRAGVMTCANDRPTPRPPTQCQNGGVATSNSTCLCQPHTFGDHCQNIACENGGTQRGSACACAAGWAGYYCQFPTCATAGPPPSYGYGVDMAFVVELSARGLDQIKQLAAALPEILRDVRSQNRAWVERFVLVGYNGTWSDVMVDAPADSYGKLLDRLNQIAASTITDSPCVVRPWDALRKLFKERSFGSGVRGIPRRSVINLYEAGLPDEFDNGAVAFGVAEEIVTKFLIMNVFQAKDPQGNGTDWYCNAHNGAFQRLENAARRGDGRFYTLFNKDIGRSAYMIPSLFSSSIVYKTYFEDCSKPQQVFFPIDAYTQTVTAIVQGHNTNISAQFFTGEPISDEFKVPIFQDENNAVTEWRNTCDDAWEAIGQYCVLYNPVPKRNFQAASDYCKSENSFMLDDLSDDKNKWIKKTAANQALWLGLSYRTGKWYFQQDNNSTAEVTKFYWKDNKTPNVGAGETCAYFDPTSTTGFWVGTTCDKSYQPVCQKHRYDQNNQPSKIGDDDIAPGKYIFTVQTDGQPTKSGWKGCAVEVKVQSDINIEWGIVNDMRNDEPTAVMNIDSDNNVIIATVSQGRRRSDKALVKHVQIRSDDKDSILLEAAVYQPRGKCTYEYYSQPLICSLNNNGSDMSVVHIGEDASGNTFQRYTTTFCTKWVSQCVNGGIYSNGACVCTDYFTGARCQTPLCQNGGTPNGERRCSCPEGFTGDACQFHECSSRSNITFSNDKRRLVLLVEASLNTQVSLLNLANQFPTIAKAANDSHPNWFTSYAIHSFSPDGTSDSLAIYSDPAAVAQSLSAIGNAATQPGNCQMRLFEAMNDVFTSQQGSLINGGHILLLTAATPVDHDDSNMFNAMRNFGTLSPVVDYVRIESPTCPITGAASNLTSFANFISSTNGIFFRVSGADIGNAITQFLPTRYAPQRLTYSYPTACKAAPFFVQVDVNTTDVYVSLTGGSTIVVISDPKFQPVTPTKIFPSSIQGLYHFTPTFAGIYQIQTSSADDACFPVVYSTGGVQVVVGFIQDLETRDDPLPYAVKGVYNYPVFHLVDPDDSRFERGFLYYTNFVRHTVSGKDDAPYKSEVHARAKCAYTYIGHRFRCNDDEDETITLSVSGVDTYRQSFHRQSTTWCKSFNGQATVSTLKPTPVTKPSTAPPVTSTLAPATTTLRPLTPKEIPFDVLFLIDETETDNFIVTTGVPFVLNLLKPYTTDQAHARVGFITIPNAADMTMPVTFLSAINNYDSLVANAIQVDDFVDNDTDPTEIRMTRALQYAHGRFMFPANGYRTTVKNHLIVMLTETSTVLDSANATLEAAKILNEQSFGIITVGYGPKVNMTALSPFAGTDCTFIAPDYATLTGAVTQAIQNKIWAAYNSTGGKYCGVPNAGVRLY